MAREYGVHGRSWGAFCVDVAVDVRVLVCRRRTIKMITHFGYIY